LYCWRLPNRLQTAHDRQFLLESGNVADPASCILSPFAEPAEKYERLTAEYQAEQAQG
jgi:hypothetical protein